MGLDFIRKAAKPFRKRSDWDLIKLGTPDLFTREPNREPRTYIAALRQNEEVNVGEELGVRLDNSAILVLRGLRVVAAVEVPSPELLQAMKDSHGEAYGRIVDVQEISGIADIEIC